jgi:hypothetical protein
MRARVIGSPFIFARWAETGRTLAALGVRAALGIGVIASVSPPVQAAPKVGERVAITACPHRGVVATCLMITAADGTVYNISGANPRPRPMGHAIWLRGTVTDKVSMCAQGVVLDRIRWTRVPRRCQS